VVICPASHSDFVKSGGELVQIFGSSQKKFEDGYGFEYDEKLILTRDILFSIKSRKGRGFAKQCATSGLTFSWKMCE
jgi:hypothetical protein